MKNLNRFAVLVFATLSISSYAQIIKEPVYTSENTNQLPLVLLNFDVFTVDRDLVKPIIVIRNTLKIPVNFRGKQPEHI